MGGKGGRSIIKKPNQLIGFKLNIITVGPATSVKCVLMDSFKDITN